MHGMEWCVALLVGLAAVRASAGQKDDLACLPANTGRTMLHAYLLGACQQHFDARRKTVEALATPDAIRQRQQTLRKAWLDAVGPFPAKTPLNPKVVQDLKELASELGISYNL